jgi:Mg2+-importing ATPase
MDFALKAMMESLMSRSRNQHARNWMPWLVGVAALTTVITLGLRFSEGRAFLELAARAQPGWLLVGAVLQAGTYVTEGAIWFVISATATSRLRFGTTTRISLAKLFVDQALPSAGLSGSMVTVSALRAHGVPRRTVAAAIGLECAGFHSAHAAALGAALALGIARGHMNPFLMAGAALFVLVSISAAIAIVGIAGGAWRPWRWVRRITPMSRLFKFLQQANKHLVRSPRLLAVTFGLQLLIIALDTATMLAVIRSLGAAVPSTGVFLSFMTSSLLRTVGVVPGGLGTFDASSVVTLRMAGATLPVALSATLLFRGLSYWLPLLPGLWYARRLTQRHDVTLRTS